MENKLQTLKMFLEKQDEIVFAYLFGSQATGKVHALSDIDIAIYVQKDVLVSKQYPYGFVASLLGRIPKNLQAENIDFVLLNEVPILLRHRCIEQGKLLFSKNQKLLTRFKVQTLLEYFDTKPLREKIRVGLYGKK